MALDFVAGCLGGCAGVAVGHPLDTVKVRLQTQDPRNPLYRGTFHCLRSIFQQESFRGLYRGMSSPMAGVAAINAIVFGVYGNVQRQLPNPDSMSSHAMAGATAGFVQSFVCSPMELVKTRIQIQGLNASATSNVLYKGPMDCFRQIWHHEGIRGIFRGLGITIAREIPAFGLYFWSYEVFTRQEDPSRPIGTLHMMTAGGAAGMVSWIFTYPMDVLKSRLQVDGLSGTSSYRGIADCIVKSYRNEGINAFVRGMSSTIIRAFPVNATTFTVVTWFLRWTTPVSSESSVAYEKASSVIQESLTMTATFAREHDIHLPDWTKMNVSLPRLSSLKLPSLAVHLHPECLGASVALAAYHSRCTVDKAPSCTTCGEESKCATVLSTTEKAEKIDEHHVLGTIEVESKDDELQSP